MRQTVLIILIAFFGMHLGLVAEDNKPLKPNTNRKDPRIMEYKEVPVP